MSITLEKKYSEIEFLRIFPEVKEIAKEKIEELQGDRRRILTERTLPFLKKVNATKLDDFGKNFYKQAYLITDLEFVGCIEEIDKWNKIKLLTSDNLKQKSIENFERKKEVAKDTPIQSLYPFAKLRGYGKRQTALCPFHHENTPSFVIYTDQNTFHCFGCGKNGDSIEFMKFLKDCTFKEAVGELVGGAV